MGKSMSLLNQELIGNRIMKDETFAPSHGAKNGFLGGGILYYGLPYMFRAKTCVCLGSGSGFVPRLMRQAQLDLEIPDSKTILIDANLPEAGWGKPDYFGDPNFFTENFDIDIIEKRTADAAGHFRRDSIDYLHIDADHSFEAVKQDLMTYKEFMTFRSCITLHDSIPRAKNCGVWKLIEEVRLQNDYDILNLPVGLGLAIFRHKRV